VSQSWAAPLDLDEAAVNHEDNARDGDGGLSDVCRHDDLAGATRHGREDGHLVALRQTAVHGQHTQLAAPTGHVLRALLQLLHDGIHLGLAGEERQHVALAFILVELQHTAAQMGGGGQTCSAAK